MCAASVLALNACNSIDTPNGKIPMAYQEIAREKVGIYTGKFDGGKTARFEIIMEDDQVRAQFIDPGFGSECQAELGLLKSVQAKEVGPQNFVLERAVFAFDPKLCADRIPAREMIFSWNKVGGAQASFLSRIGRIFVCDESTYFDGSNGSSLRELGSNCSWEKDEVFESSLLQKQVI